METSKNSLSVNTVSTNIDPKVCSSIYEDKYPEENDLMHIKRCLNNPVTSVSELALNVTCKDISTWTEEDGMSPLTCELSSDSPGNLPLETSLSTRLLYTLGCPNSSTLNNKDKQRNYKLYEQNYQLIHSPNVLECSTVSSQLFYREKQLYANIPKSAVRNSGVVSGKFNLKSIVKKVDEVGESLPPTISSNNLVEISAYDSRNSNIGSKLQSFPDLLGVMAESSATSSGIDRCQQIFNFNDNYNNSNGDLKTLLPFSSHFANGLSNLSLVSNSNLWSENINNQGGDNFPQKKQQYIPESPQQFRHHKADTKYRCDDGSVIQAKNCFIKKYKHISKPFQAREHDSFDKKVAKLEYQDPNFSGSEENRATNNAPVGTNCASPRALLHSNYKLGDNVPFRMQLRTHPQVVAQSLIENKNGNPSSKLQGFPYMIPVTSDQSEQVCKHKNKNFGFLFDNNGDLLSKRIRINSPRRSFKTPPGKTKQSFDYGEIPSHQMFPRRYLLEAVPEAHYFSYDQCPGLGASRGFNNNFVGRYSNQSTNFQPCSKVIRDTPKLHSTKHRSFPAGLFSYGATTRSCSMGDLTSNNSPSRGSNNLNDGIITSPDKSNGYPTTHLATSLPLPPATSITYEFSLAPVSGTLAPGWHLTAVQRGLATAVPLAAVVARRRLLRTRPRHRMGFQDKNEARRAKCTIVITALALLAMSMFLVGLTLRLAPFIDDLVRKENENLLSAIHQTSLSLNASSVDSVSMAPEPESNVG